MKQLLTRYTALALLLGLFAIPATVGASDETEDILSTEPLYLSFTGTVEEVRPVSSEESAEDSASQYVVLKGSDDSLMTFVVDDTTLLLNEPVLEEGQSLIGFYDGNQPAILIYPPQMPAMVLTPYVEAEQVVMSYFDADLISSDGSLKLLLDDTTIITDQAGEAYTEDVAEHVLVVIYGPSTRSIPAQTTPIQIVVMDVHEDVLT